jgi:ketosteroid isomerase-like protein
VNRALVLPVLLAALAAAPSDAGEAAAPDAPELIRLLGEFLAGASRSDAAVHDRFWAEDLVYTGSNGRRRGKAEVLADVRSAPTSREPETTYAAEDVQVRQYGETAIVTFRLVGITRKDGRTSAASYLNTGTFVKRGGRWQAAGWQATRMARPDDEARRDAAAVQTAFHRALVGADVKVLESLLDEGFVWTHHSGRRQSRRQLLDEIAAGTLRYSKLEAVEPSAVSVYGDAAVVRGESYTATLVNRGGEWTLVALHSSLRPGP